jgi:hypothetical protein
VAKALTRSWLWGLWTAEASYFVSFQNGIVNKAVDLKTKQLI